MKRYLVTGGCGFIGSHLVDALLTAGNRVRVLDDLSTGTTAYLSPEAELIIGDIRDAGLVRGALNDVNGCFHLAAVASVARCNQLWQESHQVNLSSTVSLFEAASNSDLRIPVVYASSAAVYGDHTTMPLTEDLPPRPLSPYGADKASCELHARAGSNVRGLVSAGLRFFNVYGPRQRPDSPYSGVISIFADRVARGEPIRINGDGEQTRDFVYVGDVVSALGLVMWRLETAIEKGTNLTDILNVCSGSSTTICELAHRIMAIAGKMVPIVYGPAREGDIRHSVGSPAMLLDRVGDWTSSSLNDGLGWTLNNP